MSLEELNLKIVDYNPHANLSLIESAYRFAEEAHKDERRESGEPYFTHVYETAMILTTLHADSVTITAALLHDILENTSIKPDRLKSLFGGDVFALIEGVTKTKNIALDESVMERRAENIRKVLLATAKDIRVIFIKLADRLDNMRTLKFLPNDRQVTIAKETMEIYAPISHKLGINSIKAELEDLSFRYIQPDIYQDFKKRIGKRLSDREHSVAHFMKELESLFVKNNIPARVFGRAKSFYSIYRKMQRKNLQFEEVTDLIAVRVITTTVENCYKILGLVHMRWRPIPGKFDDYIVTPKQNMYQSLHTEVLEEHSKESVEVQIRTLEMHHIAEEGVAAHWRYKGTERDKRFEDKVSWLKQVLTWKRESRNAREFVESLKVDLFKDEIVVFTPKGDPITLPEHSSPIDFAFEVHTDIGNHCSKAKVNGKIVPLDSELSSGDIVEIITSSTASPSRQWLKFCKSPESRQKIRHTLGIEGVDLEQRLPTESEILSAVDLESELKYSRCCSPMIGDSIVACQTKDHHVIHKIDCLNIPKSVKCLPVSWKKPSEIKIELMVRDRIGLLAEVLNVIANLKIDISSIETRNAKERLRVIIGLRITDEHVDSVLQPLSKVNGVIQVGRFG